MENIPVNEIALSKGNYFFPKYLNETIQEYPERMQQAQTYPSQVRSHGQVGPAVGVCRSPLSAMSQLNRLKDQINAK
jgi:hypothetical protein